MKKLLAVATILAAALAVAGSIKVWAPGDVLSSTDLNANFAHIHGTMVGGHGARLVNADVSPSAALAHSKLASPSLLPKAVTSVDYCTASPCSTGLPQVGVTSVTRSATGSYAVNLSPARTNTAYFAVVSSRYNGNVHCNATVSSTSVVNVVCINAATAANADGAFSFLLFDDND